jgi:hypothetical protein
MIEVKMEDSQVTSQRLLLVEDILKLLDCFKYISPLFKFKMARPASFGKTIRSNNP